MKRIDLLPFKLNYLLFTALKIIILFIGFNILLTTIFVLLKDQNKDNFVEETSYLLTKDYLKKLKNLS